MYAYHISACNNVLQKLGAGDGVQKKMLSFIFRPESGLQGLEDSAGCLLATSYI